MKYLYIPIIIHIFPCLFHAYSSSLENKILTTYLDHGKKTVVHEWYFTALDIYKREWAPLQGKGVIVGCIDTGVALVDSSHTCNIHPALQTQWIDEPLLYYNCIEDLTYMLFYHINFPAMVWYGRFKFLENAVYKGIQDYLVTNSLTYFEHFLKIYGIHDLFTSSLHNQLSPKGKELITLVKEKIHNLKICYRDQYKVPLDTLCLQEEGDFHGVAIAGLIAGNSVEYKGIAPRADIIIGKAFYKQTCTVGMFINALLLMIKKKVPLVCMSLQIPTEGLSEDMKVLITSLIKLIPYSVAPSGNNAYEKKYVSFPANITTFSVGSFTYDPFTVSFPIAPYSQYEDKKGPLFVAPGANLLVPYTTFNKNLQKIEYDYRVLQGTSFAAAFMTGLLALFLAEASTLDFNRRELLTILYSSGLVLENNSDWKQKSIFGTLDISTALFIVLVLRATKRESTVMRYFCETYFDQCVGIMHLLLKKFFYKKTPNDDSISFFKNILCSLLTNKIPDETSSLFIEHCHGLLRKKDYTLFSNLSHSTQRLLTYHYARPQPLDYDLCLKLFGVYETERIKEDVESYLHYYWS